MLSTIVSAAWHARMTHEEGPEGLYVASGLPVAVFSTFDLSEVAARIEQANALALQGMTVVGGLAYEAAPAFDEALAVQASSGFPLLEFHAFNADQISFLPLNQLQRLPPNAVCHPWRDLQSHAEYVHSFEQIQKAIEAGEFYQINLTTRLKAHSAHVDAWQLFQHLYVAQPAPQSIFLRGGAFNVLSLSPELFFHWDGKSLTTAPMKGTRQPLAGSFDVLSDSEKDRAENVMIVDLLRNDMAKVCQPRSVQVRSLFDVMHLPTVDQMTSSIAGQTLLGTGLKDVFAALFPCGSVTGAPKSQAMMRIAQWEKAPRLFYCGALGVLSPGGVAHFNVPIRTVVEHKGMLEYGVGSGITWYSTLVDEKREWWQKTVFLRESTADFCLLETLRLENGRWRNLDSHLQRMSNTANHFSYVFNEGVIREALLAAAAANCNGLYRARCLLTATGKFELELHAFEPDNKPVQLRMASRPMDALPEFVLHKTTHRPEYDTFQREAGSAFDVLLFDRQGHITETCRCNIVLKMNGELLTPQISESTGTYLLPGVFRAQLLRENAIRQTTLHVDDLQRAEEVWLINSLRGWVPVSAVLSCDGKLVFSNNTQ